MLTFEENALKGKENLEYDANAIVGTYIKPGSISQVNIPNKMCISTMEAVKKGGIENINEHTFDAAKQEIYLLMSRDSFKRFLASDLLNQYLRGLKDLAISQ